MVGDRISGWWRISVAGYIVTRRVAWVRSYVLCMAEFFSRVQQWGTLLTSCMLDPRLTYFTLLTGRTLRAALHSILTPAVYLLLCTLRLK